MKLIKQKKKILNISFAGSKPITKENTINTSLIVPTNQANLDRLSRNKQIIGTLRHYPPAIKEWYNSIYTYNAKNSLKLLPTTDKTVYNLLKAYFNLNPSYTYNIKNSISKRLQRFSMIRVFIGKPEMKHSNNKVIITVYTYNRKKVYLLIKIKKLLSRLNLTKEKKFAQKILNIRFKNTLKNKKRLFQALKLLKKNLQKKNSLLLNHLKKKSIPFFFFYLRNKLSKTTRVMLANSANKSLSLAHHTNIKMPYLKQLHNVFNLIKGRGEPKAIVLNKYKNMSWLSPLKLLKSIKLYKIKLLHIEERNTMERFKKSKILLFKWHKGEYISILHKDYSINYLNSLALDTDNLKKILNKKLYRKSLSLSGYTPPLSIKGNKKYLSRCASLALSKLLLSYNKSRVFKIYKDIIQINFYKNNSLYKLKTNLRLPLANSFLTKDQRKFLFYKNLSLRSSKLKKGFSYKHYCSMLYFNNYIFNTNNILPLKEIIKKIYMGSSSKKVEVNIINLKYLYLDSNIFAEAITRKLKDRQKRVLRVLKLGLKLTKKPYFKIHFHKDNIKLNFMFCDKKLDLRIKSRALATKKNTAWLTNTINVKNKYLIYKPNVHKMRLFLYHMKQKIISGIRLQGTGRLTKRLTASRSISKVKYIGSLKNINSSYENISTVMLRGFVKSNLQYININNYNRNGSFGVKVSISVY